MSSRIAPTLVARRPLTIRAEMGTQPAWQMNAMGLPAVSKPRTKSSTASERRSLSGAKPPGMTRASKSAADTSSTVVSTASGPYPFLPVHRLAVQARHRHRRAFLPQAVQRVEQLHVLEEVGREDEHGLVRQRHGPTLQPGAAAPVTGVRAMCTSAPRPAGAHGRRPTEADRVKRGQRRITRVSSSRLFVPMP